MHILLLCTGNSCRSQMAAACLRARLQDQHPQWGVESAGVCPEQQVMPESLALCAERGWPVPEERPKRWQPDGRQDPDAVWVFSATARDTVRRRRPEWTEAPDGVVHVALVPDPIGKGMEAYRQSADAMVKVLEDWLAQLMPPKR